MAEWAKNGLLLIDKPRDLSSFAVVSRLRRLLGERKIGHIGTLDPFAEGLLVVCLGRATAAIRFMEDFTKTYEVRVAFGRATDTMDRTGTVTECHAFAPGELAALAACDFAPLRQVVRDLVGPSSQLPPMFSAVKMNGRPLYALARTGQTVERQPRPIVVHDAAVLAILCRRKRNRAAPAWPAICG